MLYGMCGAQSRVKVVTLTVSAILPVKHMTTVAVPSTPGPSASGKDVAEFATVLVIEDDEHIAHVLKFMLERQQYRVTVAADGRAACALIEGGKAPDLVLMDVMLPYVDGFELVRIARAQPGWQAVPIVMLTAKTMEQDIVRALDAGANDYVLKPFQPNELLARLRRYLRAKA
jgi:DNA-binding response OmpR family regulator